MTDRKIKFDDVITALLDNEHPFPSKFWRSFSDLSHNDIRQLEKTWPEISRERKVALFEDLETIAESDTLVNFDEFAKLGLSDHDPEVKVLAIRSLWECEDHHLIPLLTDLMMDDSSEDVRAASAFALGRFVYLGELEVIPESLRISNIQNLLEVVSGEDLPLVRRRALESLGFSSHPKVPEMIRNAIATDDSLWITSALYAMGRSADEQWEQLVLSFLNSPDNEIEFEAIRAAGELELDEARDLLVDKLEETVEDTEKRYALIWALSQIGGEGIKEKFEELLEKAEDDEEIEWLEKGLDNLELGTDIESGMGLMGFAAPKIEENDDESEEFFESDETDEDEEEFEE